MHVNQIPSRVRDRVLAAIGLAGGPEKVDITKLMAELGVEQDVVSSLLDSARSLDARPPVGTSVRWSAEAGGGRVHNPAILGAAVEKTKPLILPSFLNSTCW